MSLLSANARRKADTNRYAVGEFVREAASRIPKGSVVLDAGAGNCRYRPYFEEHRYIAADFCRVEGKNYKKMDLITDLANLALADNSVDAVINTEVLEHMPEPLRVIQEFKRVLKPGGSLYLTCPLNWGVHEEPYDFHRFTNYGIQNLFESAGMLVEHIRPKGGYFWLMAKLSGRLPYIVELPEKGLLKRGLFKTLRMFLKEIFEFWLPWVMFHLDGLDKKKAFTLGYLCIAKKP